MFDMKLWLMACLMLSLTMWHTVWLMVWPLMCLRVQSKGCLMWRGSMWVRMWLEVCPTVLLIALPRVWLVLWLLVRVQDVLFCPQEMEP